MDEDAEASLGPGLPSTLLEALLFRASTCKGPSVMSSTESESESLPLTDEKGIGPTRGLPNTLTCAAYALASPSVTVAWAGTAATRPSARTAPDRPFRMFLMLFIEILPLKDKKERRCWDECPTTKST